MESVPEFAILFEEISGRNLLHSLSFALHVLYSPFHLAFLLCVVFLLTQSGILWAAMWLNMNEKSTGVRRAGL